MLVGVPREIFPGERRVALERDLPYVRAVLERGAAHAHEVAAATYARAADAVGLLPA